MGETQTAKPSGQGNYASASDLTQKVLEVLKDKACRGQVFVVAESEATVRFPNLAIASLGAIRNDKPNGVVTARVLFDGTNGRDQERAPIAADLKRSMRENACGGQRHSSQYRRYVRVASASYYWSCVASSLGRLSQYLVGERAQTWHACSRRFPPRSRWRRL